MHQQYCFFNIPDLCTLQLVASGSVAAQDQIGDWTGQVLDQRKEECWVFNFFFPVHIYKLEANIYRRTGDKKNNIPPKDAKMVQIM